MLYIDLFKYLAIMTNEEHLFLGGENVAGNGNSGNTLAFKMSEKELEQKIREYNERVESGEFFAACWPHFRNFLGYLQEDLDAVVEQGMSVKGAYYTRALMLRKMGETCEMYLSTLPYWRDNKSIAKVHLLQGHGWTRKYTDSGKDTNTGPIEIKVAFGGSDPRGKKAAK